MKNCRYIKNNEKHESGFTIVEVLLAVVFVGLAIVSLVGANVVFTQANGAGIEMSTAEFLLEQIRELTVMLPICEPNTTTWDTLGYETGETLTAYDDIDDFDGFDSTGLGAPINSLRQTLTDFSTYSQQVTVDKVNPSDFEQIESDSSTSNFARITVDVYKNSKLITSSSWLRARY